jgi:hypothetical protein
MALVVTLAGLALLAQPARRDGAAGRVAAIVPAPAGGGPVADTRTTSPRPAESSPADAAEDPAPADPAVVAEREDDAALPAVPEPGDIVVALAPSAEPMPRWLSYVHTSESAQPMGPPLDGGAAGSSEGADGPEAGALYWFGPAGLVRLAMEARR